jgi:hypothetical protein
MKHLLQVTSAETLFYYGAALSFAIVFCYLMARWVFSIDRRIKQQDEQIALLTKMAEKLGVTPDEIEGINNRYRKQSL